MDRASVRPRLRYPWLSLLWYSVVIGPSVAIGVLCYSALQFRYIKYVVSSRSVFMYRLVAYENVSVSYMFVHGQPCSGPECYGLTPLWSERLSVFFPIFGLMSFIINIACRVNAVGWQGYVANYTTHDWSEYVLFSFLRLC